MGAGGGHDDQLLVEPERRGVIEPVQSQFGDFSTRFEARWFNVPLLGRASLSGEGSTTRYSATGVGDDRELRLTGGARRSLASGWVMDVNAEFLRFRRQDLDDFNVNLGHGGVRLAWVPDPRWLVSGSLRHSWISFPDRILLPDTSGVGGDGEIIVTPVGPEPERDRQLDFVATGLRRLGSAGFLVLEASQRRATSNEVLVEYSGPTFLVRAGSTLPGGSEFSTFASFSRRDFRATYSILASPAGVRVDRARTDEAWQFGFTLERPLREATRLFAEGSWVSQKSTIADFTFDHARFAMGFRMDLWSSGSRRRPLALPGRAEPRLAPRHTSSGVRFLYQSVDAVQVSLVGDFNAWDPTRHPMSSGGAGLWEVTLPLAEGIWRYSFVVDGRWVRPPDAPLYEADGFGGENGVLETRSAWGSDASSVTLESDERPRNDSADGMTPGRSAPMEAEWKEDTDN